MEREPTGWIKIDRNILEWRWYSYPTTFMVWIHLLLKANYKDVEIGKDVVRRGEVYVAQELLAKDIGVTKKQLRIALENLKETGEIRATRKIGKVLVISIPNYDKYQGEGQRKGNERATERALKGQHIKKDKNIKNNSLSHSLSYKPYHKPTVDEVREYERTSGQGKDPEEFFRHYSAEGWKANGKRIYSWQKLYDQWQPPEKTVTDRPKRFTDSDGITYELVNGSYEKVRSTERV